MRPLPLPCTTRAFWELVGEGMAPSDAGVAVGVSVGTGRRWFADSGGVKPRLADVGPRRRPRLSFEEREEISVGVAAQESVR
jgi:IS30 family transposase